MATVIDSLIVTLGLDPKNFKKGSEDAQKALDKTKKTTTAAAADIERFGKNSAKAFSTLKTEALSFLAILAGASGIKSFVGNQIAANAEVSRSARNLGVATTALSAWQKVAEKNGGTSAGITGTIKNLSDELAKFKLGLSSEFIPWFARAGGDFSKLKDVNSTMLELSRILSAIDKIDPPRALLFAKNLGIDEGTFNLLRQGPAAVQAQIDAQIKLGVVTDENGRQAERLQAKWAALAQSAQHLGNTILTQATPALEKLLDFANKGTSQFDKDIVTVKNGFSRLMSGDFGKLNGLFGGKTQGGSVAKPIAASTPIATAIAKVIAPSVPQVASNAPRGIRNNNPGNLNFAGQNGARLEGGNGARFAAFGTMEQGVAALVNQLKLYQSRGIDSISEIVKKYAPASENNVGAYIDSLVKATGKSANEKLDLSDTATLLPLIRGIVNHENGKGFVGDDVLQAGARLSATRRAAASTSSTDVKIGTINIQTQATDAAGIAKSAADAFRSYPLIAPQANTGLAY